MHALSIRQQSVIGLALATVMVITRGQHLALAGFMPDASWAVFFLAGVYLRAVWALPGYMLLALGLDVAAVGWGGVSGFCLTPAYLLLLPAHAVLWGAGRWYARLHRPFWRGLVGLAAAVTLASLAAEVLSSGGFYLFSGRFTELSAGVLAERLLAYYPASLAAMALYVGTAAGLQAGLQLVGASGRRGTASP
jgi:hypothetical protein